jgi:predicted protein tyrosine phosphatase
MFGCYAGESRSTDRLAIIAEAAVEITRKNPEAMNRIKKVSITWQQVSGELLPVVQLEFKD